MTRAPEYAYLVALATDTMLAVDHDHVPHRRIHRLGPGKGFSLKPQVKESVALSGAQVTVDSAGQLEKRVTATRLVLAGPLAFGLRKKQDSRELFLMVEGEDGGFVVEVNPKYQRHAREAAVKINALARAAVRR